MPADAPSLSRRGLLALAAAGVGGCARGSAKLRLRAATDVSVRHVLTATFRCFLDRVAAAFPDEVTVELFHSGQLYYDRDMARAVMRGDLDMAAPTITTLSRVVPDCNITSLPAFYGRGAEASYAVAYGPVGDAIRRRLEARLGVIVPDRYVDLGPIDLFYVRRDAAARTIAGRKIRVPSGAANVLRLRALGAYPVMLPFADVPMALAQGTVDAIESTAETVLTGQLWDAGLTACVRQQSMFIQYVPLIGRHFWDRASQRLRAGMLAIWCEEALFAQGEAARRQAEARAVCAEHGIAMIVPEARAVAALRARLSTLSDRFVARLGIDPVLGHRAIMAAGAA